MIGTILYSYQGGFTMLDNILVTKSRIEALRNELLKSSIIIDSPVIVTLDAYRVGKMVDTIILLLTLKVGEYKHQYKRVFKVYEYDHTNDTFIYIRQVLERDIERLEELRAHKLKYNRGGTYNNE